MASTKVISKGSFQNEIFLLPRETERVIVQYQPVLAISFLSPRMERDLQYVKTEIDPSPTLLAAVSTPPILFYQTFWPNNRPHVDCNCAECRSIKPRFIVDTYLYACKVTKEGIHGKSYLLGNVHTNASICFGRQKFVIKNPRQASSTYWLAPFNMDLWPLAQKHKSTVCPNIKHPCGAKGTCPPIHNCARYNQLIIDVRTQSNSEITSCPKAHLETCVNHPSYEIRRIRLQEMQKVFKNYGAFLFKDINLNGNPLKVRVTPAGTLQFELQEEDKKKEAEEEKDMIPETTAPVPASTQTPLATPMAETPVQAPAIMGVVATAIEASAVSPSTAPSEENLITISLAQLSEPLKAEEILIGPPAPLIPCNCNSGCACCDRHCSCRTTCECCLKRCGHVCPCDLPGKFATHLKNYSPETDISTEWKNITKNICGNKYVASSKNEEAVFVSTAQATLEKFSMKLWRNLSRDGSGIPAIIGFATKVSSKDDSWKVRVEEEEIIFTKSEVNIC